MNKTRIYLCVDRFRDVFDRIYLVLSNKCVRSAIEEVKLLSFIWEMIISLCVVKFTPWKSHVEKNIGNSCLHDGGEDKNDCNHWITEKSFQTRRLLKSEGMRIDELSGFKNKYLGWRQRCWYFSKMWIKKKKVSCDSNCKSHSGSAKRALKVAREQVFCFNF